MSTGSAAGRPADALRRESELLAERLVSCLPAATFEMETLVRLAGVEATRDVPTAAITCDERPRLLLNPDFVARNCKTDEHLFLLAMHELWHVILAHTRLYPRATPAENVALDAVINAALTRQFPGPEYRGFFERLNEADSFPGLLLRPPNGWPWYPSKRLPGPPGTTQILRRLYPRGHEKDVPMPLYAEILELLERAGPLAESGADGDLADATLVGNHGDAGAEASALDDPLFGEVVRRVVAAWPPPPVPLGGRDAGSAAHDRLGALHAAPEAAQRAFARVLRRVLGSAPGRERRRRRAHVPSPSGLGPLPNPADRTLAARRALGLPALLQKQLVTAPARVFDPPAVAHVYVDVSGSMDAVLPWISGLLWPWVSSGRARCFQFSNDVQPLAPADLREGRLRTTGGTDIDCVLEHWLERRGVRRALVLTDGYVGSARADLAAQMRRHALRMHVVLPAESGWRDDLAPVAASITQLPPLRAAGTRRISP
jgi:hypothetical protein